MAEVRPARNGRLCKSMFRGKLRALARMSPRGGQDAHLRALSGARVVLKGLLSRAGAYREHSMATNSSVLAMPIGMAPVISSRSTLRKEAACVYSRERQ
jgi:hypothetical protein